MKNKKLVSILTVIIIIASCACLLTGCKKVETDFAFGIGSHWYDVYRDIEGENPWAQAMFTSIIHTVRDAEPLGPSSPLSALIIAPCTGNTLAKLANGITDSAVTMAAKAHLRSDRPLLIAAASNDAMSQNLSNIGRLITRRGVYFVPMRQDDPRGKPYSLVADFDRVEEALSAMKEGRVLRPMFV